MRCVLVIAMLAGCARAGGDEEPTDAAPGDARIDAPPAPDANNRLPCVEGDAQAQDELTGHCYMYFDTNTNWTAARAACEAVGAGVTLATITSAGENAIIATLVPGLEVWVGGNDLAAEMTFVWISGDAFEFTNWRAGEPNNGGNEDCIAFQGQLAGVWDDRSCGENHRIVCERD